MVKRKFPPQMDEDERREVVSKLGWEGGLDYLICGSNFPDIRDKKFHKLRKAFVKAAQDLSDYLRLDDIEEDALEEPLDEDGNPLD